MKEPKYKTIFSSEIRTIVSEEKDEFLALASMVDLEKFIPDVDTNKDVDLLPIAFNAFVANRVNKNGDVIDTDSALAMYKNFKNKPINVEHNRDRVIGTLLTAGFSEFGTDKPLTEEEIKGTKNPFNVTLGGVIWKVVNPNMADFIEDSADPTSENYMKVSASWELGFTDYNIVKLPEGEKNIANGSFITDQDEVDELSSSLKSFGGDGKSEDGSMIYRQVVNEIIPLGVGLTENPAAEVAGVSIAQEEKEELNDLASKMTVKKNPEEAITDIREKVVSKIEKIAASKNQVFKEKYSQKEEKAVSQFNRGSNMKVTNIDQITDDTLKELSASAVSDFIEDELKKASEDFHQEKSRLEESMKASLEAQTKLEEQNKTIKENLDKVNSALAELESEKAERESQDTFNSRMSALDEQYELTNEDRQVIATQIKNLDEETFASYLEQMQVLLSSKDKETLKKAEAVEAEKVSIVKASEESKVEEVLDKIEEIKEEIPVSATASDPEASVYDKYRKAFDIENWSLGSN
jgi:hypothetical protein